MTELTDQVGVFHPLLVKLVEALAQIDLALACAKYADDTHAAEPLLVPFHKTGRENHPGSTIMLYHARHPLLDPAAVVPIDVTLDERTFALVITAEHWR